MHIIIVIIADGADFKAFPWQWAVVLPAAPGRLCAVRGLGGREAGARAQKLCRTLRRSRLTGSFYRILQVHAATGGVAHTAAVT